MALLAPTLGDFVEARYPHDKFKGVTTTSLYGKSVQYNRIYKYLGLSKGHGHEHISEERYQEMLTYLRDRCVHCNPRREEEHDRDWWREWAIPLKPRKLKFKGQEAFETPHDQWCTVPDNHFGAGANARMRIISAYKQACAVPGSSFEDGSNPRMRRISEYSKVSGDGVTLTHGRLRGVYYHPAVASSTRQSVIRDWFERCGSPRYERSKNQSPPYQDGLGGPTREFETEEKKKDRQEKKRSNSDFEKLFSELSGG
jgi:hypothetical protein